MKPERFAKLRALMAERDLDAVAFVPGNAFRYYLGVDMPFLERPTLLLLPREGEPWAVVPAIERPTWEATWAACGLNGEIRYWRDEDGYAEAFASFAGRRAWRRVGVEGFRMRVAELFALRSMVESAEIVPIHAELWQLRAQKDGDEIALIRRAVQASEQAIARTWEAVRVGMTEAEVKSVLQHHIAASPGIGVTGENLVLAGANSARPHGRARFDYRIQRGDALLIDFAATCEGYASDITRTAFVGAISPEQQALYQAVRSANAVGREMARPGATAHEVDDAVQRSLAGSGFGDFILHKTGHGLGLDVHELPHIMRGNHTMLSEGHVITIEPGLYKPGEFGVRIEDVVTLTGEGREELTTLSREPTIVG